MSDRRGEDAANEAGRSERPPPRSVLFFPGHRREMLDGAVASGADAVCLDLEDAVPPSGKEEARSAARAALERTSDAGRLEAPASGDAGSGSGGRPSVELLVRVNAPSGREGRRDLRSLREASGRPAAVVVPGAASVDELDRVAGELSVPVVALVESPEGLAAAESMAREASALRALALGPVDMARQLGCELDWEPLLYTRSRLVHAAALGGVPVLDGPYTELSDPEGLAREARASRRLGFDGKLALHPRQVEAVNRAFTPSEDEVAEARAVLSAFEEGGGEAVRVRGRMVDRPVAEAARRTLSRARRAEGSGDHPGSAAEEDDGDLRRGERGPGG